MVVVFVIFPIECISGYISVSFTGQVITRIMTTHGVMPTFCADQWDSEFHLDEYCHEKLYFWKNNIEKINKRDCFVSKCHS